MPLYKFINVKTKESREIFFHMNDLKIYNGEENKEVGMWRREYYSPNASIDTKIDPYSVKDFLKVTNKSGGTVGQVEDISRELSEKRGGAEADPIRHKHYENWSKKRCGKDHPEVIKVKRKERLKKLEKKYGIIAKDT